MATSALDTIIAHLKDTGRKPSYYDAIITGDLGHIGKEIVIELAEKEGYNITCEVAPHHLILNTLLLKHYLCHITEYKDYRNLFCFFFCSNFLQLHL